MALPGRRTGDRGRAPRPRCRPPWPGRSRAWWGSTPPRRPVRCSSGRRRPGRGSRSPWATWRPADRSRARAASAAAPGSVRLHRRPDRLGLRLLRAVRRRGQRRRRHRRRLRARVRRPVGHRRLPVLLRHPRHGLLRRRSTRERAPVRAAARRRWTSRTSSAWPRTSTSSSTRGPTPTPAPPARVRTTPSARSSTRTERASSPSPGASARRRSARPTPPPRTRCSSRRPCRASRSSPPPATAARRTATPAARFRRPRRPSTIPSSQPFVTGVGGTSLHALGPAPDRDRLEQRRERCSAGCSSPAPAAAASRTCGRCRPSQLDSAAALNVRTAQAARRGVRPLRRVLPRGPRRLRRRRPGHRVPHLLERERQRRRRAGGLAGHRRAPAAPRRCGRPCWRSPTARARARAPPVGYANPALYRGRRRGVRRGLQRRHSAATTTSPAPTAAATPPGPGYDPATGLGTPNAASLAAALCADTIKLGTSRPPSAPRCTCRCRCGCAPPRRRARS